MKRIRKFARLSRPDQSLLLQSLSLLAAITLGLRLLSFQTLQRVLAGATRARVRLRPTDRPTPQRITWSVRLVSRHVPGATCLSQALAAQTLFLRQGYPAELHIGVAKNETGQLEAHAWVESEGQVVIGDLQNLSRYTPLPSLEAERA